MKDYQQSLTSRRRVPRGTEQLFPCQGAAPPPRPVMLDALATFHLYFDGARRA